MVEENRAPQDESEHAERARPKVVDKRISTTGGAPSQPPPPPPPADAAPADAAPANGAPADGAPADVREEAEGGEVWTPEREAQARRIAEEIASTPSLEWVVNTAVTLANVAGTKLDLGAVGDAGLAIDALAALVGGLGDKLKETEAPLRQTLAQLQMAFAQRVAIPPE
jgi:hypothetical protein